MAFQSGSAGVVGLLTTWLNRKFVSDLEWALQYQKFGTKAIIPPGSGKIGRFNVFVEPPANTSYSLSGTSPLTETYTTQNEIATITAASTDVTIAEYGEFHKTTALAMYAALPGSREKLSKRLRDGANVVIDTLCRNVIDDTTNYFYCNNDADGGNTTWNTGSVTGLSAAALMHARKILFGNKAKGFSGISGHPDGHYAAVIGPKGELDIVTETTTGRTYWSQAVTNVPGKTGQEKWVNGYIGSIYGVAVYTTQNHITGVTYSASSTGDIAFIMADGGWGCMSFKDMQPEIIINDVNSPYKNTDSIAWKVFFGAAQIDGNRTVKAYHST